MAKLPPIGDIGREGIFPDNLVSAVRVRGAVCHKRHRSADPFEAVPDPRGNGHELIAILPQEEFKDVPAGG